MKVMDFFFLFIASFLIGILAIEDVFHMKISQYKETPHLQNQEVNNLTFFVIGDWGGSPDPPYYTFIEESVSSQISVLTDKHRPDFLLALGDNFYYDGVSNVDDARFKNTYESVFNATSLAFPWYVVAGNHDWHGNVSAQIAYSKKSIRWNFPDYSYSLNFSLSGARLGIVMIDTIVLCGNSGHDDMGTQPEKPDDPVLAMKTWQWIEQELQKFKDYDYVLVAGHYPVWSVAEHGPTHCLLEDLNPLLDKYNVTAYLSGHDHNLQHLLMERPKGANPLNYFVIGAANFVEDSQKHKDGVPKDSLKFYWASLSGRGGLGVTTVTKDQLTISMVDAVGQILYRHSMKPRHRQ